jgi:hypothetical protein
MSFLLASVSLCLRRLRTRGLRRRPLSALDVLLRRRPLLSHLRRRPLRLRLWPRLFSLGARACLRRRSLLNRLLSHRLLLLRVRPDLLFSLRGGPLSALSRSLPIRLPPGLDLLLHGGLLLLPCGLLLLTLGLSLRLLLLSQSNLFSLRVLSLGHARGPFVRRLRRGRLRRCRLLLLSRRTLLLSVLPFELLQLASGLSVSAPRLRRERGHLLASLLIRYGNARPPRHLIRRGAARLASSLCG